MKVTFVTPRYGVEVVGGAESGARSLATHLAADGWEVEVLTTRATSAVSWADDYPGGTVEIDGVTVRRFGVVRQRDPDFDRYSARVLAAPSTVDDATALEWIDRQGPDSPDLLDAIAGVDDGVLALYPYLYQPTVRGALVARVPAILHAAAHPEPPLDLPVFDEVFGSVAGFAHHSAAEQRLVGRRFPATARTPQVVLGLPVEAPPADTVSEALAARARDELGIGDEPFVVCLGRVDRGKGTDDLVRRFVDFRAARGRGRLVLAGPVVHDPPSAAGVTVLGLVSGDLKTGLLAAADVLVNPSPHESFSIVIHEAWLAGTPVLVNGWCGPTVEHCAASGGGLWWTGRADFDVALGRLLDDRELRDRLATNGAAYARRTTSWPAVRRRYEALLSRLG